MIKPRTRELYQPVVIYSTMGQSLTEKFRSFLNSLRERPEYIISTVKE